MGETQKKKLLTLGKVKFEEKIFFTQNLALMLRTGFSISEAILTLKDQTNSKYFKKILNEVHERVVQGETFSEALNHYPNDFDNLFVSMIEAGEQSGNLEGTLVQITQYMKKSYALKRKIRNALTYPVIILVLIIGMSFFMFTYVMPRILLLYEGTDAILPLPTRIVMGLSNIINDNIIIVVTTIILLALSFWITIKNKRGREIFDRLVLKLPIAGTIIKKINVARFARILNSLIVTDIPIVQSYDMISRTLKNSVYRKHMSTTKDLLTKGKTIYSTLHMRPDLFDPVIAQMIRVGEDSGSLDEMTAEIATFYEEDVDQTMTNLTTIIEPMLMIILGFGVGLIAVAVIMPIYGLVNQI